MLKVKYVETANEYQLALEIRKAVFIIGQNVPEHIEIDQYEDTATHILAIMTGQEVGTARWRQTNAGMKLERFAVLEPYRGTGIGKTLVEFALHELQTEPYIYLYAQQQVIPFYEQFSFKGSGNLFLEADIPHIKMVFQPK